MVHQQDSKKDSIRIDKVGESRYETGVENYTLLY